MIDRLQHIARLFAGMAPACDAWQLRLLARDSQAVHVRQDILQPLQNQLDLGAYLCVVVHDHAAYAATSDVTASGLKKAAETAIRWAKASYGLHLLRFSLTPITEHKAYHTAQQTPFSAFTVADRIALVQKACGQLKIDPAITDWHAHLNLRSDYQVLLSSAGGSVEQIWHFVEPGLSATAHRKGQSQERSGGGWGTARQGGLEQLAALGFGEEAPSIAEQALLLLRAPVCPDGKMDLVLSPSQMMLQIHESIGHPLELDRILGDERNFAGRSFVTLDMFGRYQYGSQHLNVTFDPDIPEEMASYGYDDEGEPAKKTFLIREGKLLRPLGGATSQRRSALEGVACARACHWNRPPIDRMANLNIEPGGQTSQALIASVENGVYMDTNRSWSIDDSRNKFQFGCEWAQIIQDGELKHAVRNPNYRGISASFWRSLAGVGNRDTVQVCGTPHCGKGEPNQVIHVGHASPPCLFTQVDVFGGS